MSKKYEREEKALVRLEQENRVLKATIRSLNKRIRNVVKGYNKELDNEYITSSKSFQEEPIKSLCDQCNQGILSTIEVAGRTIKICDVCSYRSKAKKL